MWITFSQTKMTLQEQYDDAMFDFSTADYDRAIEKLKAILAEDPQYFDAQLSLGMAYYRKGDYPTAIQNYDAVLEQFAGSPKAPAAQLR